MFPAGGQQASQWAGACSVALRVTRALYINGVRGAQSEIGRADLGQVSRYNRTGLVPSLMVLILGHRLVRLHEMYFKMFKIIQNAIVYKNTLKHSFVQTITC